NRAEVFTSVGFGGNVQREGGGYAPGTLALVLSGNHEGLRIVVQNGLFLELGHRSNTVGDVLSDDSLIAEGHAEASVVDESGFFGVTVIVGVNFVQFAALVNEVGG